MAVTDAAIRDPPMEIRRADEAPDVFVAVDIVKNEMKCFTWFCTCGIDLISPARTPSICDVLTDAPRVVSFG